MFQLGFSERLPFHLGAKSNSSVIQEITRAKEFFTAQAVKTRTSYHGINSEPGLLINCRNLSDAGNLPTTSRCYWRYL